MNPENIDDRKTKTKQVEEKAEPKHSYKVQVIKFQLLFFYYSIIQILVCRTLYMEASAESK